MAKRVIAATVLLAATLTPVAASADTFSDIARDGGLGGAVYGRCFQLMVYGVTNDPICRTLGTAMGVRRTASRPSATPLLPGALPGAPAASAPVTPPPSEEATPPPEEEPPLPD